MKTTSIIKVGDLGFATEQEHKEFIDKLAYQIVEEMGLDACASGNELIINAKDKDKILEFLYDKGIHAR